LGGGDRSHHVAHRHSRPRPRRELRQHPREVPASVRKYTVPRFGWFGKFVWVLEKYVWFWNF
jgi:hypothetical protein